MAGSALTACPFCRQMFEKREAKACPECGLDLVQLTKLPPSYEAELEEPGGLDEPEQPHMETLPFTYLGRGRGLLALVAAAGIGAYFAPFYHELAPRIRTVSGFAFARELAWMGMPLIAWFVMLPLVLSRRSIYKMRGARLAVAGFAVLVVTTVGLRLAQMPTGSRFVPVRIEWGLGLYLTGILGLVALALAFRFGGPLDDVPTRRARRGDETIH